MTKFVYMKLLGLILVILGFSYCLTSFSNFYGYIFGDMQIANANIYIMSLGLLFPLYMFIFGVYFYFYTDKQFAYINPFILISGVAFIIVGGSRIFLGSGIMEFIHSSFAYVSLFMGSLLVYGCIKFKY